MESVLPIDADRPTRAEIRLGALRRNFRRARELAGPGVKVMCAIKANAYGHGILRVAQELVAEGSDYLGVAFLEEGIFLRRNGVEAPILVLGAINGQQIPRFLEHGLDLTIPSVEKARAVSAAAAAAGRTARVHLKIDTGMERIGVQWSSAVAFFDKVLALPSLEIVGLFSHFATADEDLDFARLQLERFSSALGLLRKAGVSPPFVHIANSAALVNLPEARFSMVRPGILLYGYEPTPIARIGFEPVMRLMSKVAYFKVVRANTGVSYGLTWRAAEDTRVVTVPIGYGDGYSRALSNKGVVVINGRSCPIVGRICMDQLMVDIGPHGEAHNGDDVLLFGVRGEDRVDAELLCERIGTIPYELTSMISARVPRIYVED
ncbi:MAG TPA: alanine racemase [Rectinemataceae bacterium]|nr:alanine racemase [Rectinemataceae bacterium]